VIAQEMNIDDYIDRLGASLGIDTSGLIKSAEQKAQEKQQMQEQQQMMMAQQVMGDMATKATPEAAKAVAQYTQGQMAQPQE
jgi:23S rRNA pseudoU1915 N3-methylase RlmH